MFDADNISARNYARYVCHGSLYYLQSGSKITLTPPDTKYIRVQKCHTL